MKILLDYAFAWLAVIIALLLSVVYITRKLSKGSVNISNMFSRINKGLRKHHKVLGIFLIFIGLIHGILSSGKVLSFNLGTIAWIVSILLGINYMLRKYLARYKGWMFYHRGLTVIFIGIIILHIIDVGGIQAPRVFADFLKGGSSYSLDQNSVDKIASGFSGVTFKDGVYTGEATGYRPGLNVSVTVSSDKVTDIKITSHNEENPGIYQRAMNSVPKEIVESQSLDVDTVSGATRTSVGIINAVNNALQKAVVSGTLPKSTQSPQEGGQGREGKFKNGHGFPDDRSGRGASDGRTF